jgi:hypothetical protein
MQTRSDTDPSAARPPPLPRMVWVLRFATELHRLHPLIDGPAAASIGAKTFDAGRDRSPESAARAYAELMPPQGGGGMSSEADA